MQRSERVVMMLMALALSHSPVLWGLAQDDAPSEEDEGGPHGHQSYVAGPSAPFPLANAEERARLFSRVSATGHVCEDHTTMGPALNDALRLGGERWLLSVESTCFLGYHALVHFLVVTHDRIRPASFVTPWPAPPREYGSYVPVNSPRSWMRGSRDGWLYEHEGHVRLRSIDCGRAICDVGVLDTYEWQQGRFVQLTRRERDAMYATESSEDAIWPITEPRAKRCGPRLEIDDDGRGRLSSVGPRGVLQQVSFDLTFWRCEESEWNTIRCHPTIEYQAIGLDDDWVVFSRRDWTTPPVEVARIPRGCSALD